MPTRRLSKCGTSLKGDLLQPLPGLKSNPWEAGAAVAIIRFEATSKAPATVAKGRLQ